MKDIKELQEKKIKKKFDLYTTDVLKVYNLHKDIRYQISLLDSLDVRLSKHSENVANISNKICNYLNLNQKYIEYVVTCAYIHDIGKLYIPPSIAKKPIEELTNEEYIEYMKHADIGFNICRNEENIREFLPGPYYHHERLDGTGFPQGLKGKDIPFEAKIIAVANMYDHLLNDDVYKNPKDINNKKSKLEILSIMRKARINKEIDRTVFSALIKAVKDEVEYEIYNLSIYINHLNNEIDRFKEALKHYNIAMKTKNINKKEYHEMYTKGFLTSREEISETPKYLKDAIEAYQKKMEEYKKLKKEFRAIRTFRA